MIKKELLNSIVEDKSFKLLCDRIAGGQSDDLYQEFILTILESKDNRMNEAKEGGYLSVYCVGIINNIWNNRGRRKKNKNGKTSPLMMHSNYDYCVFTTMDYGSETLSKTNESIKDKILTYSAQGTDLIATIKKELSNMLLSEDNGIREDAQALYSSIFLHKNIYQYSKSVGIYDLKARRQVSSAIERIKKRIK